MIKIKNIFTLFTALAAISISGEMLGMNEKKVEEKGSDKITVMVRCLNNDKKPVYRFTSVPNKYPSGVPTRAELQAVLESRPDRDKDTVYQYDSRTYLIRETCPRDLLNRSVDKYIWRSCKEMDYIFDSRLIDPKPSWGPPTNLFETWKNGIDNGAMEKFEERLEELFQSIPPISDKPASETNIKNNQIDGVRIIDLVEQKKITIPIIQEKTVATKPGKINAPAQSRFVTISKYLGAGIIGFITGAMTGGIFKNYNQPLVHSLGLFGTVTLSSLCCNTINKITQQKSTGKTVLIPQFSGIICYGLGAMISWMVSKQSKINKNDREVSF